MKKIYLSILFLIVVTANFCQPGTLDSSFGINGISVTGIANGSVQPKGSVVLKNDKIIVLASIADAKDNVSSNLLKYLPNGEPDNSFGENGSIIVTTNPPYPTCLTLLKDEKFAIAAIGTNGTYIGTSLFKINADGSKDSSFGMNGIATDISLTAQRVADIAEQPDSKLVICGYYTFDLDRGITYALLSRFNTDGTLDKSFGENGHVINKSFIEFISLTVQPDGKVLCTGRNSVLRYNSDGSPDKNFGEDGVATATFTSGGDVFKDVINQPDGKIIAVGNTGGNNEADYPNMAVARFNADGRPDKSFGKEGKISVAFFDYTIGTSVALQKNLKIIVAGSTATSEYDFCAGRLLPDGTLDSTFGINGKAITTIQRSGEETYQVSLQSTGNIIVGSLSNSSNNNYSSILARYYGDPVKQQGPIAKKIRRWIRNHTLQWQPLNDNDVSYYSIQQSSNDINGFREIGRVRQSSKVKSKNEEAVYSFSLNNALAQGSQLTAQSSANYYRITAVSNSGSNITSDVIADESISSITISPNPVKDVMKITGLTANQKSTINIINRNGNILQSAISNTSTYNMNVAQLKSGLYNMQVIYNGTKQTIQFVKQ